MKKLSKLDRINLRKMSAGSTLPYLGKGVLLVAKKDGGHKDRPSGSPFVLHQCTVAFAD